MVVKISKFGKFLACSGFPECKNTKKINGGIKINIDCPECLKDKERSKNPGKIIERKIKRGKNQGKIFWGCSNYPQCRFLSWQGPGQIEK